MNDPKLYRKLLYEYEVLWARYEIREHYLKNVVQDIYQSTGQILSLVRVQLSVLSTGNTWSTEKTTEPGNLVGKAIHDLRDMCRYFTPETELIENWGFVETIQHELQRIGVTINNKPVKVKGEPGQLSTGTELIVFRMLQEILLSIKEQSIERFTFKINYTNKVVTFCIDYKGNPIQLNQSGPDKNSTMGLTRLTLQERVKVVEGKLLLKKDNDGSVQIKLIIPFKISNYEQ